MFKPSIRCNEYIAFAFILRFLPKCEVSNSIHCAQRQESSKYSGRSLVMKNINIETEDSMLCNNRHQKQ